MFIYAPLGGHLGPLQFLALQIKLICMNIGAQLLEWAYVFTFLQAYLGLELLGQAVSAHRALQTLLNYFPNACPALHPHQQHMKTPPALYPQQHLVFSVS